MQKNQAFTLIELSIALVIIGLIVGGVLVGKDLIRAAELTSSLTKLEQFKSAANTFRLKYNCMAGDCANANNFGLGANGNGNQNIDFGWCTNPRDLSNSANVELLLFWQHLGNSGLIEGSYTGVAGPTNAIEAIIGVNVPKAPISNGGVSITNIPTTGDCAPYVFSNIDLANQRILGAQFTGSYTLGGILSPEEARALDYKIDDGKPGYGRVTTHSTTWYANQNCISNGSASVSDYNLSYTGKSCHLLFNRYY